MAMSATPDRFLFIVARNNEKLANYLQLHFRGDATVLVVIDRRHGERRHGTAAAVDAERRRTERRSRPHVDRELQLTSYAIVTLP
jgi:D-serine deaminase-like pyridoxal phosphate-dependent protein